MKVFFWIMWCSILCIELFLIKGLFNIIFHRYNPVDVSSVKTISLFLVLGAILLAGGYYFKSVQKIKWACAVAGFPLMAIVLYFLVFLIIPYLMGERMN